MLCLTVSLRVKGCTYGRFVGGNRIPQPEVSELTVAITKTTYKYVSRRSPQAPWYL